MLDLNTLHQVNTDPAAYQAFREAADRACGHELETKKPEWYLVAYKGENLIPGTEAVSFANVGAEVVIPNEYGIMKPATELDADDWMMMLDAEYEVVRAFSGEVSIITVFDSNGKAVFGKSATL